MASCDELHIEVKGLGGHGALPERTVNPLFMGSNLYSKQKSISIKIRQKMCQV